MDQPLDQALHQQKRDKKDESLGSFLFESTKDEVFLKDNGRTTVKSLKKG